MCSQIFLHRMNGLGTHKNCVIELLMSPAIYDFGEKIEKNKQKNVNNFWSYKSTSIVFSALHP